MSGPQFPPPPAPPPSQQVPGAVAALVLGILSIVMCPFFGPVAWSLGRKGEQEADASAGRLGGRGLATAGKVLGIIGTILLLLLIGFILLAIAQSSDGLDGSNVV